MNRLSQSLANDSDGEILDSAQAPSTSTEQFYMQLTETTQWIDKTFTALPSIAQAAVLVVLSVVSAKMADWALTSLVGRWAKKTKTDIDDELIELMHRPVFMVVLLGGLNLATLRLGLSDGALLFTSGILKTIAIIILVGFSIRASRLILGALSKKRDTFQLIQPRTVPLFYNASNLLIFAAALYFLFLAWNIDPTAWLASAGIIGVALSFAAKDSLANLFAGAFILADAPYKLGDFVILDSGERGMVTNIGLRSTRMLTRDDVEITIPNAVMGNAKITNESGGPHEKERIRVKVSAAYGSDVDQVEELLLSLAVAQKEIDSSPEPRVRLRALGDSGLQFELLAWVAEPVLRGRVTHLLLKNIYKSFADQGIEIPYPKRDVYLKEKTKQNALSNRED
ncbi:MAG: mechanosensitive ion channel family protein [Planctomycetota bacterium]